jgi:membrane-associated phospholipid phosphatase
LPRAARRWRYLHEYDTAPWVLGGGAVFATATGVFRIMADMHWATDVMTGALVGTAIGVSVPLALHRREASSSSVSLNIVPAPNGIGVTGIS